jgi:hypothetical protein
MFNIQSSTFKKRSDQKGKLFDIHEDFPVISPHYIFFGISIRMKICKCTRPFRCLVFVHQGLSCDVGRALNEELGSRRNSLAPLAGFGEFGIPFRNYDRRKEGVDMSFEIVQICVRPRLLSRA